MMICLNDDMGGTGLAHRQVVRGSSQKLIGPLNGLEIGEDIGWEIGRRGSGSHLLRGVVKPIGGRQRLFFCFCGAH